MLTRTALAAVVVGPANVVDRLAAWATRPGWTEPVGRLERENP